MSVYHCPLCPLIFEFRSEMESHLSREHRPVAPEEADLQVELAAAAVELSWEGLAALRASLGRPSVSLLLATTPSATMTVLDVARLRRLADRVRRRLRGEPGWNAATPVVEHRLSRVVSAAESLPTELGLAVFVNHRSMGIVRLPFAPRDRHVVDPRFATRDLEYALRRFPRYRLLVLGHHPRILEGRASQLSEADLRHDHPDQSDAGDKTADWLLQQRVSLAGRLPVILIGERRYREAFVCHSRHASDVVAEVSRPRLRKAALSDLAAHALEELHYRHQERAIADLHHAEGQDQIVWGVQRAWNAVRTGAADRVWVEHDFAVPGRTAPGACGVETSTDPAEPGAIDDLLDVLITKAAGLGIPVDLLDKDTLECGEPVAARLGHNDRACTNRVSHPSPPADVVTSR